MHADKLQLFLQTADKTWHIRRSTWDIRRVLYDNGVIYVCGMGYGSKNYSVTNDIPFAKGLGIHDYVSKLYHKSKYLNGTALSCNCIEKALINFMPLLNIQQLDCLIVVWQDNLLCHIVMLEKSHFGNSVCFLIFKGTI